MLWESLYQYQREGVEKLLAILQERRGALLADPPGAGKTAMATTLALRLQAKRILVISPASLRENWVRELRRWSDGALEPVAVRNKGEASLAERGVVVTSYALASKGPVANVLQSVRWDLLICDESHALKNASSQAARSILVPLWSVCRYRLLMTGTPLPNGQAIEGYTTFSRLSPEDFPSWESYRREYCVLDETPWGPKYTRSKNLPLLREKCLKFMVRRPKDVILGELPELVRQNIPLRVPELEAISASEGLDLQAIVSAVEAGVPLESDAISTARRKLGELKVRGALEFVKELGEPVVVFAHHKNVMERMREGLEGAGLKVCVVDGSTPAEERQKAVDAFQNGVVDVFLGSLRAAGVGLTLTRASALVMVEADWVPSVNEQAEARIHRLTQKDICRVFYLVVPDSLDEMVLRVVQRKQRNIKKVLAA